MSNLQFWHSSTTYNGVIINTYYLAENRMWLFSASDICNVIDKINNGGLKPASKSQIRVFQNNEWITIAVLQKEDILEAINASEAIEVKSFKQWVQELCSSTPEDCFLSKSSKEYEFLNLATNRFLDIYEEINSCSFMDTPPETRLHMIKDFFSVYTEMLSYPPIREHVEFIEKTRPPMESVISSDLIKFVRNLLAHFPFFTTWDEIYISKQLANWASEGRSIDRFLKKYQGHEDVEYRFKESMSGKWRYPTIKFPQEYDEDKIFLKDILDERDGVLLCAALMYKVVSSQIIST